MLSSGFFQRKKRSVSSALTIDLSYGSNENVPCLEVDILSILQVCSAWSYNFFTFLILFLAVPWQFLVSLILFHRLSRDGHHQHPTKSLLCLILQSFTFPILFSVKLLLFLILPFYLTPSAPDPPPLLDPATLHVYDLYLWSYFTAWSWEKRSGVKLVRDMYRSGNEEIMLKLSVKALILTLGFHPLSSAAKWSPENWLARRLTVS